MTDTELTERCFLSSVPEIYNKVRPSTRELNRKKFSFHHPFGLNPSSRNNGFFPSYTLLFSCFPFALPCFLLPPEIGETENFCPYSDKYTYTYLICIKITLVHNSIYV